MTIDEATHCKDCEWWELLKEAPEVDGYGACHLPVAYANYQIWWEQHPELHEGLNPPNAAGGFAITGCNRICKAFEQRGVRQ